MGKNKSDKNEHTAWIFLRNLLGIFNTVALTVQVLSMSNISMLFSGNKPWGIVVALYLWGFQNFFWLPLLRTATSHTSPFRDVQPQPVRRRMLESKTWHITPFFGSSLVLQRRDANMGEIPMEGYHILQLLLVL